MRILRQDGWTRRGLTLLWDARVLTTIVVPAAVRSMRELFGLRQSWPEELPGASGDALVVAGLEGCLDALAPEDAITWLETELKPTILSFQEHYDQAALILWVASGRARIEMSLADGKYAWKTSPGRGTRLPLGQSLWGGTDADVARIVVSDEKDPDVDGSAYVGLHHPRIS